MQKHLQSGMTFIELTIMILIIGILLAVVVPNANRWLGRGKEQATKSSLQVINNAVQEYQADTGQYPQSLEDLMHKPQDLSGWNGAYIKGKTLPHDGWNQEFVYKVNPRGTQPPFELYSYGDPTKEDGRIHAE
jgi:general secretion pathway protein G